MISSFPKTSPEELRKKASGELNDKITAIENPEAGEDILSTLISDPDPRVRAAVAAKGYGLHILCEDISEVVRKAVVEQGYGIAQFIHDPCIEIREELAQKLGHFLAALVEDPAPSVRAKIAEQGIGLNALAFDKDKQVRDAVAKQGYDGYAEEVELFNSNKGVRPRELDNLFIERKAMKEQACKKQMEEMLAHRNGDIKSIINDPNASVRLMAAEEGIGLDTLVYDSNVVVKAHAYDNLRSLASQIVKRFRDEEELKRLYVLASEVRYKAEICYLLGLVDKSKAPNKPE